MKEFCTKFFGVSTVGERGQIVIPSKARDELGIDSGDKLVFFSHESILHLAKAKDLDEMFEKIHQKLHNKYEKIKDQIKNEENGENK